MISSMRFRAPKTLNDLFFERIADSGSPAVLVSADAGGHLTGYRNPEFADAVLRLRVRLLEWGLSPGDRVALIAPNSPEWHIAEFGILTARLVVVPVYCSLSPEQTAHILRHSDCRAVLWHGERQQQLLRKSGFADKRVCAAVSDLISSGPRVTGRDMEEARQDALLAAPEDLATIVYTSGTTGPPKGVMLTHRNFCFGLEQCVARLGVHDVSKALSVLPLAHVFERLLCYAWLSLGMSIAYGDPHDLKALLKLHDPDVAGVVPRILERIVETVQAQIDVLPAWKQSLARALLEACMENELNGRRGSIRARGLSALADALLFRRIRRQLGSLRFLICGGAWLDPRVEVFYRAAGFTLIQGYGMTETSPVICLNNIGTATPGSVGRPLDGVEVRINEDGELLTRGPHVMRGYHRDDAATRAVLKDGWLRTGDLASRNPDGSVVIRGRLKEQLILSTGKNVAPALVEQALCRSEYIERCVITGDRRKFVAAIIIPNISKVRRALGKGDGTGPEELLSGLEAIALFRSEIAAYSETLADFEKVKRFCFLIPDAGLEADLFTPTQKFRRGMLESKLAGCLNRLYAEEVPFVITSLSMATAGAILR
jgi:long-chain acyl-CoA synthetase